jgi:prepilin-type N-terminal cleavage/methylation domain-containing protein
MTMSKRVRAARGGFTMLELLVVISVIAIIATFAVGAATKSFKGSREKRVATSITGLEIALQNYRAQVGKWPFKLSDLEQDPDDPNTFWAHAKNNVKVFQPLYHGAGSSRTVYLDGSALFTEINGARIFLNKALENNKNFSIGYPLPANPDIFCYFCVEYKTLTDTVKVHRQDVRRAPYTEGSRVDGDHTCTRGQWIKAN